MYVAFSRMFLPIGNHPITLLSIINKLLESIINKMVFDHLNRNSLLNDKEYWFPSSRFTADVLNDTALRVMEAFVFHLKGITCSIFSNHSTTRRLDADPSILGINRKSNLMSGIIHFILMMFLETFAEHESNRSHLKNLDDQSLAADLVLTAQWKKKTGL